MNKTATRFLAAASLAALALSGCVSVPGAQEGPAPVLPGAYEYAQGEGAVPAPDWWTGFGDPTLDALVAEAMRDNLSLEAGRHRLTQARTSLRTAQAVLYPSASASISTSTSYAEDFDGDYVSTSSSSGRLSVQYDADLFGANRASVAGARASFEGQEYGYKALVLSTQADVALSYFNLLAARERLALAQRNLDFLEQIMELVEFRYEEGAVSGADVARQRSAVASARARIPQLTDALIGARQSLAILLGDLPQAPLAADGELLALTPPGIAAGLPSDLLLRRPDLLQAQATLAAADADVAVARAAFLPSLDLSAALSSSLDGDASLAGSLSAGLAAPIFQGGRLRAGLDRSQARYAELEATWRQSILQALAEVEAALVGQQTSAEQEAQLAVAVEQADRTLEISTVQYRSGATDLLDLLDAQRSRLSAEESLISARLSTLSETVNLYRALGGGWQS